MMIEGRAAAASSSLINLGKTMKGVVTEDRRSSGALLLYVIKSRGALEVVLWRAGWSDNRIGILAFSNFLGRGVLGWSTGRDALCLWQSRFASWYVFSSSSSCCS